jgi:hypothetical protein
LVNEGNIGLGSWKNLIGTTVINSLRLLFGGFRNSLEYISKFGSTVELPSNKINGVNRLDKRVRELEQKVW